MAAHAYNPSIWKVEASWAAAWDNLNKSKPKQIKMLQPNYFKQYIFHWLNTYKIILFQQVANKRDICFPFFFFFSLPKPVSVLHIVSMIVWTEDSQEYIFTSYAKFIFSASVVL